MPVLDLVHERAGVPGFASDQLPGAEQAEDAAARLVLPEAGAGSEIGGRVVDTEAEARALLEPILEVEVAVQEAEVDQGIVGFGIGRQLVVHLVGASEGGAGADRVLLGGLSRLEFLCYDGGSRREGKTRSDRQVCLEPHGGSNSS